MSEDRLQLDNEKLAVRDFWERASCGEDLLLPSTDLAGYAEQGRLRYELEPEILRFAEFERWAGRRVLEIGVGLGADHQNFAAAGAILSGVDLTSRAIEHTRRRLQLCGLHSDLRRADAEALPFDGDSFDLVYSWGVLMASPNTPRALAEVHRVLKPGGQAKLMVYHKYSVVGFMLWIRYGLLRARPLTPLSEIYAEYLESPGMKAYSEKEARQLFASFRNVNIEVQLSHADLLTSEAGQRHRGALLTTARKIWPRWLLRRVFPGAGLFMMIEATK